MTDKRRKKSSRINMTEGNVALVLRTLTIPMIFGVLGLVAFNLADTYFVGRLGMVQIAALTFTFPVVLVINSINLGLGIGASAVISKAVGEKNQEKVVRLSTDALTLGVFFSIIAIFIGELTVIPLFTALGAKDETMPYILSYMRIWYAGVPFVAIPMIGNSAIRALGDTKTPSIVMMIAAGGNIILDPLLIFGLWIFPELGVAGAATATVFSRMITFTVALYVLGVREKAISFKKVSLTKVLNSWREILYIGLPAAVARMILPIGVGIITRLVSGYGLYVVAGYGIATRFEYFALAIIRALSSVIPVFVGQNYGAGKFDRIKEGMGVAKKFSLMFGAGMYLLLLIIARPVADLFTDVKEVADITVLYMRIVPLGYGLQGIVLTANGALNALRRPLHAASLNLTQMLVIYVPLGLLFSKFFGVQGIFAALVLSYLLASGLAIYLVKKTVNGYEIRAFEQSKSNYI